MRWISISLAVFCALAQEGVPARDAAAAGDTRVYPFDEEAGRYSELRVEPMGARLEVSLAGGPRLLLGDARMRPAVLCWVSGGAAKRTLAVKSLELKERREFGLALVSRAASDADRARARGCAALSSAEGAERLERLQEALKEFEAAGDGARQAETLTEIGVALWDRNRGREGIVSHEKAVTLGGGAESMRRLGVGYLLMGRIEDGKKLLRAAADLGAPGEADALNDLAMQISREGALKEAEAMSDRALQLAREAGDRRAQADAENMRGVIEQNAGRLDEALARYAKALALREGIADELGRAQALNNTATVYTQLADPPKAIELLERVLEIRERLGGPQAAANTKHNLGVQYMLGGEYDRAVQRLEEALEVWRATKHTFGEASSSNELGQVYLRLGLEDRAERTFRSNLERQRQIKNKRGEAQALLGLSSALLRQGRMQDAERAGREAMEVAREANTPQEQLRALQTVGRIQLASGRPAEAVSTLGAALELGAVPNRVDAVATRNLLGRALLAAGRRDEAWEEFQRTLVDARAMESRSEEYAARAGMAEVLAAEGKLDEARTEALAAVELLEDLRTNVSSPDVRARLLSRSRGAYRTAVDILMRLGREREAFAMSERGRARALLDLMQSSRAPVTEDERRLAAAIQAKAARLTRMLAAGSNVRALRMEIAILLDAHAAAQEKALRAEPRSGRLATTATAEEIEKRLGEGEALVEFSLGDERSYAWVITSKGTRAVKLAGRAEIERAAESLRRASSEPGTEGGEAGALERMLFPAAVEGRKLYIVPDGALHYAPLLALPTLAGREVAVLPSASVLPQLEVRRYRSAAVFADPVYEAGDERFVGAKPAGAQMSMLRASEDGLRFPRLRFSQQEADAIAALTKPEARLVATGFAATREAVLKAPLDRYDVLHFATHAVLNEKQPELSGIVLSLYGKDGRAGDGFLRMNDVAGLALGSPLVVLSACQTALGKSVDGEGLIGLSRAFLAAGASGVVATLWQVDDAASAHFMKAFHEALLRRAASPAEALRTARQSVRSQAKWAHPFYWAGYVYLGR